MEFYQVPTVSTLNIIPMVVDLEHKGSEDFKDHADSCNIKEVASKKFRKTPDKKLKTSDRRPELEFQQLPIEREELTRSKYKYDNKGRASKSSSSTSSSLSSSSSGSSSSSSSGSEIDILKKAVDKITMVDSPPSLQPKVLNRESPKNIPKTLNKKIPSRKVDKEKLSVESSSTSSSSSESENESPSRKKPSTRRSSECNQSKNKTAEHLSSLTKACYKLVFQCD